MICIVGAGNMGKAILAGLVSAGHEDLAVVSRHAGERQQLQQEHRHVQVVEAPVASDMAVVATKPWDIGAAVKEAVDAGAKSVASVAAGVRLDQLQEAAGSVPVVRCMPNVGALVARSATAICSHDDKALRLAEHVFAAVGHVTVIKEEQMDTVTALAGTGPAYFYLVVEAMTAAAVRAGLTEDIASQLAEATFTGAAKLMQEENVTAEELRKRVTTPNGTTAAGLDALQSGGLQSAFDKAIVAASKRSAELAGISKTE